MMIIWRDKRKKFYLVSDISFPSSISQNRRVRVKETSSINAFTCSIDVSLINMILDAPPLNPQFSSQYSSQNGT